MLGIDSLDSVSPTGRTRLLAAPERSGKSQAARSAAKRRSGPQSPRRGRVQKQTNNSSTPATKTLCGTPSTWERMEWLREESRVQRQRKCGMRAHSDVVNVTQKGDRIGYRGVMLCGSRRCPDCGEKLARALRDDLEKAISRWRAEGGIVYFGTFTLRHRLTDRFTELADAISHCWERATSGSSWIRDRKDFGIDYWFRVQEEKYSDEHGWHIHVHFLVFAHKLDGVQGRPDELLGSMFRRWRAGALSRGLKAPLIRAQDMHEVTEGDAAELASYFAKQTTDYGAEDAEDMSWELSSPSTKTRGGIAPAEILVQAMRHPEPHTREQRRILWHEYEQGMVGRRVIAWSRGLRDDLGLGPELTAGDVQQQDVERKEAVVQVSLPAKVYTRIVAPRGNRAVLAEVLLREGPAAARDWCHARAVERGFDVALLDRIVIGEPTKQARPVEPVFGPQTFADTYAATGDTLPF